MSQISNFFITKENIRDSKFIINDLQDVKKIRKVLRLRSTDNIQLMNGEGKVYLGQIAEIKKDSVIGEIIKEINKEISLDKPKIVFAQGLLKASKFDTVIKMNTEVGVSEFIPFESEYSVIKVKNLREKKYIRWEKIAKQASQQSERPLLPILNKAISFDEILELEFDQKALLVAREEKSGEDIYEFKSTINGKSQILVVIGPEGGFSDQEVLQAREKGFKIVHVDLPVLRSETAGVVINGILLS